MDHGFKNNMEALSLSLSLSPHTHTHTHTLTPKTVIKKLGVHKTSQFPSIEMSFQHFPGEGRGEGGWRELGGAGRGGGGEGKG